MPEQVIWPDQAELRWTCVDLDIFLKNGSSVLCIMPSTCGIKDPKPVFRRARGYANIAKGM